MTPAILLMGPTASGKTALSIALAGQLAAAGWQVEIISVDSAQVYRGMDIGTAKPSLAERGGVPHHLIDLCDPAEAYSAARFRADALRLIADIGSRGHLPLLVGGSMLYFRAITTGLSDLPAADPALREQLARQAQHAGWPAMHAELVRLDPQRAAELHPNDGHRIQRALEVVLSSGVPMSALRSLSATQRPGPRFLKLALAPPTRTDLHARIATRLQQMMAQGLCEEVARLFARGDLHLELPSIRSVGYRQLWAHLEGECDLATATRKALEATRQFAKRQITWLRSEHDLCWLNSDAPDAVHVALRHIAEWMPKSP